MPRRAKAQVLAFGVVAVVAAWWQLQPSEGGTVNPEALKWPRADD